MKINQRANFIASQVKNGVSRDRAEKMYYNKIREMRYQPNDFLQPFEYNKFNIKVPNLQFIKVYGKLSDDPFKNTGEDNEKKIEEIEEQDRKDAYNAKFKTTMY